MNKHSLLLIAVCSLALSGCGTTPPPEIQIRYTQVATLPPDDLLVDCPAQKPPAIEDYLALPTWPDKEGMLVDNISLHISGMGKCNIRWDAIRKWKIAAQKAVDAANAASAPAATTSP